MSSKQPDNFSFRGQRPNESVVLFLHQHPLALLKAGLIGVVIIALMTGVIMIWQFSRPAMIALTALSALLLLHLLYNWFLWWNSHYLITDQRLISVRQQSLFNKRIDDYGLEKIQSVSSEISGLFGNFMNFGTLYLVIIGLTDPIRLVYIEDPLMVHETVNELTQSQNSASRPPRRQV
ncbi:MAG: hypothetical protein CEO22_627 [Candidatus Berkelbacteria bacterium Gr01-1014_85]|uniref:Uncharacterized protein n=1 Tax=Candidatus Berkelbacteria bacterium Gr01-1014_85 TaxID=2017150 RepID=A0A554J9L7_9BACT|nr:MAG: hypothetical protein CEO22_627 [Candidatus Berkelbacteria bacterium Gr01-1014_85]